MGKIMTVIDGEIQKFRCDDESDLSREQEQEIQVEVLDRVLKVMLEDKRTELDAEDRGYIQKRVRLLVTKEMKTMATKALRFAKLDRVVCNIGGERGWAPGSIQSINEEDPMDPTGQVPCSPRPPALLRSFPCSFL